VFGGTLEAGMQQQDARPNAGCGTCGGCHVVGQFTDMPAVAEKGGFGLAVALGGAHFQGYSMCCPHTNILQWMDEDWM